MRKTMLTVSVLMIGLTLLPGSFGNARTSAKEESAQGIVANSKLGAPVDEARPLKLRISKDGKIEPLTACGVPAANHDLHLQLQRSDTYLCCCARGGKVVCMLLEEGTPCVC
jgi:hypothetical protein